MKKLRSLFLIVVACLVSILFTDKVFAEVVIEYPVYSGKVYLESMFSISCIGKKEGDSGCYPYIVSEDDGIYDDEIRLTSTYDSSSSHLYKKSEIASGFVASATKNIDIPVVRVDDIVHVSVDQLKKIDGVTKIKYLKYEDSIKNILDNASEHDFVYNGWLSEIQVAPTMEINQDKNIVVKKGVTLAGMQLYGFDTIKNDGRIKAGEVYSKKIIGNGVIDLCYDVYNSIYFNSDEISGVKLNLINTELKEGLRFVYVGSINDYTTEEAQKKIDMYNSALSSEMSDYEIILAINLDDYDEDAFVGVLEKKQNNTSAKKTLTSTGKIKGSIEFADSISNNYVLDIKSVEVKKDLANKDVKYIVDISVLENGSVVKIDNNKMKIKIAIPEELKGYKKYEVVYISDDKIKETIPATIEDGYIVFETSHLSEYGIIAKEKQEVKNPKTGDTILYIVGAIILSASALVVSYKKIRQN